MFEDNVYSWHPTDPTRSCVFVNSAGVEYEEFSCIYPIFDKFLLPFERTYDPVFMREVMRKDSWTPVLFAVLYLAFVYYGPRYFENRPAWNWRKLLALWNLSLAVFSAWGFSRSFPHLMHNMYHYNWKENMCLDPENNVSSGTTGLAAQMFALSKIPELFDTIFIVVHKKPLIFLHWYHHFSVMLVCWLAYTQNPPTAIMFGTINYGVHAVMYFYYFLMAVHCKPKWFNPIWITIVQIVQMIVGTTVTALGGYILWVEKPAGCALNNLNIMPFLILYASYLVLFVQFFVTRYVVKVKRSGKPKKTL